MACDTPENLSKLMLGANHLALTVKGSAEQIEAALQSVAGVTEQTLEEGREPGTYNVTLSSQQDQDLRANVFFALAAVACPILSMHTAQMSLEEVFLELTEDVSASTQATVAAAVYNRSWRGGAYRWRRFLKRNLKLIL